MKLLSPDATQASFQPLVIVESGWFQAIALQFSTSKNRGEFIKTVATICCMGIDALAGVAFTTPL
jgi:hypothetical protein